MHHSFGAEDIFPSVLQTDDDPLGCAESNGLRDAIDRVGVDEINKHALRVNYGSMYAWLFPSTY